MGRSIILEIPPFFLPCHPASSFRQMPFQTSRYHSLFMDPVCASDGSYPPESEHRPEMTLDGVTASGIVGRNVFSSHPDPLRPSIPESHHFISKGSSPPMLQVFFDTNMCIFQPFIEFFFLQSRLFRLFFVFIASFSSPSKDRMTGKGLVHSVTCLFDHLARESVLVFLDDFSKYPILLPACDPWATCLLPIIDGVRVPLALHRSKHRSWTWANVVGDFLCIVALFDQVLDHRNFFIV